MSGLDLSKAEPDWIAALRAACQKTSQKRVAVRLGFSGPAINQVLSGKYRASSANIEMAVRGKLMDGKIACPVIGQLRADICLQNQKRARRKQPANEAQARMIHACRTCARFTNDEVEE